MRAKTQIYKKLPGIFSKLEKTLGLFFCFVFPYLYSQIHVSDEAYLFVNVGTVISAGTTSLSVQNKIKVYASSKSLLVDHLEKLEIIDSDRALKKSQKKSKISKSQTQKKIIQTKEAQIHIAEAKKKPSESINSTTSEVFYSGSIADAKVLCVNTNKINSKHTFAKQIFIWHYQSQKKSDKILSPEDLDHTLIFLDGFAGRGPPYKHM